MDEHSPRVLFPYWRPLFSCRHHNRLLILDLGGEPCVQNFNIYSVQNCLRHRSNGTEILSSKLSRTACGQSKTGHSQRTLITALPQHRGPPKELVHPRPESWDVKDDRQHRQRLQEALQPKSPASKHNDHNLFRLLLPEEASTWRKSTEEHCSQRSYVSRPSQGLRRERRRGSTQTQRLTCKNKRSPPLLPLQTIKLERPTTKPHPSYSTHHYSNATSHKTSTTSHQSLPFTSCPYPAS